MPGTRTIQNGAAWIAGQQGKHFCHCGCGQLIEIKIHHHTKGIPRFILNHRILGVSRADSAIETIIPLDAPKLFECGHPRTIENAYFTRRNKSYRCKKCAKESGKDSSVRFASTERGKKQKCLLAKRYNQKLRTEMIAAYGGKCTCCGESEPRFLTMEHLNSGGNIERRKFSAKGRNTGSASAMIASRLRREGWPKGIYTILCWNCNMAKGFEGICPHQRKLQSS
jgi:hypothetical protein